MLWLMEKQSFYMVGHLVGQLDLVDYGLRCSTILPRSSAISASFPTAQAQTGRVLNNQNQSQNNKLPDQMPFHVHNPRKSKKCFFTFAPAPFSIVATVQTVVALLWLAPDGLLMSATMIFVLVGPLRGFLSIS